jgi:tetratricopeptide (TPR) repeat protein
MNREPTTAENILRKIIKQSPQDTKHKVLLAKLLSRQVGKEEEVLSLLDQAISSSDNAISTLVLKAAYLIKIEKFQQAYGVAEKIESINPKLSIAKILKGDVYLNEKKYAQSFQSYQQAYHLEPSLKILESMVKVLVLEDKVQEAIDLLENEQSIKDNLSIQFRLANLYQNIKKYEQALKYYLMIADKDKDNALVLNNLAWVYSQLGDSKAEEVAEKANKLMPKSGIIADTYGYILLANGKNKASLTLLKQAALLMPGLDEIQLHLAEAYLANDKKTQAIKILEQLMSKDSKEKEKVIKMMEQLK